MLRNGSSPCDIISNGTDVDCVNAVIEEMDAGQRTCTCNVECEELNYELSITQSLWPSKQYEVRAMRTELREEKNNPKLSDTYEEKCYEGIRLYSR